MAITFFDSRDPAAQPDVVDLDRVYCFAWERCTQTDWDRLGSIYERLPGWLGYYPIPRWFGTDVRRRWHEAFMNELAGFPATNVD